MECSRSNISTIFSPQLTFSLPKAENRVLSFWGLADNAAAPHPLFSSPYSSRIVERMKPIV